MPPLSYPARMGLIATALQAYEHLLDDATLGHEIHDDIAEARSWALRVQNRFVQEHRIKIGRVQ